MTNEMLDQLEALASGVVLRTADTEVAVVPMLVAEVRRLRAILAMLKKPDLDVLASAMTTWSRTGDVPAMLHAALTTAEQEVANDAG